MGQRNHVSVIRPVHLRQSSLPHIPAFLTYQPRPLCSPLSAQGALLLLFAVAALFSARHGDLVRFPAGFHGQIKRFFAIHSGPDRPRCSLLPDVVFPELQMNIRTVIYAVYFRAFHIFHNVFHSGFLLFCRLFAEKRKNITAFFPFYSCTKVRASFFALFLANGSDLG